MSGENKMYQSTERQLMDSPWIQQPPLGKTEVIIYHIPCLFNHTVCKISVFQARILKLLDMNILIYMIPTILQ